MLIKFLNRINETYSRKNTKLIKYMSDDTIDSIRIEHYPKLVSKYFEEHLIDMNNAKKLINTSHDDRTFLYHIKIKRIDSKIFYNLGKQIVHNIRQYIFNYLEKTHKDRIPTTHHTKLNKLKPTKRDTWLIHFTDIRNVDNIAEEGFKIGTSNPATLSYTETLPDTYKNPPGYNFAYDMNNIINGAVRDYGNWIIMFQSSSVEVYHKNDNEPHHIFWGPDVDPRSMIFIEQIEFEEIDNIEQFHSPFDNAEEYSDIETGALYKNWRLREHLTKTERIGKKSIISGDIIEVTEWIIKNWRQYSKIIMGY